MTITNKCFICEGSCSKHVLNNGYLYWICNSCHTAQVFPQPSQDALQDFYNTFHLSKNDGGTYEEYDDRMRADFPSKIALVLKHSPVNAPIKLLDVGCGKGYFIREAINAGINATGIDLSNSAIEYATKKLNVPATIGSIENLCNEYYEKFDVITFWATIEHLPNPEIVLAAIYKCLKPNGVLLCDTGLGDIMSERLLCGHSQWYDAPQHLFVFSQKGMQSLLKKIGFDIKYIDVNFERTLSRRFIRWLRHSLICTLSFFVFRPLLGKNHFLIMQESTKWPIGRLMLFIAKKKI